MTPPIPEPVTGAAARGGRFVALGPWLVELAPVIWVVVFAMIKSEQISGFIRRSWDWVGDADIAAGLNFTGLGFSFAILLLCVGATLPLPRRTRYLLLAVFSLALNAVFFADALYATHFNALPSVKFEVSLAELLIIRTSIEELFRPIYLGFFIDSVILILATPFYLKACRDIPALSLAKRGAALPAVALISLLAVRPALEEAWRGNVLDKPQRLVELGATMGVLPYHLMDATLDRNDFIEVDETEQRELREYLQSSHGEATGGGALFGHAKGANLIMLTLESLMAFPIGAEVDGQEITPRINEFAKESLHFVNFHDQAWLGNSTDSEFVTMQSLYPLPFRSVVKSFTFDDYYGLPRILSEQGYATFSAVPHINWFGNLDKVHAAYGFQRSYFEPDFVVGERIYGWMNDYDFLQQMADRIASAPRPFYAYLATSSTHHPYDVPKTYRVMKLGALEGSVVGNYLHAVHYADAAFGAFLDRLRGEGLLETSIIAIYGDHKAYLGDERAQMTRLLQLPSDSQFQHWRIRRRVPLIVRLPGGAAPRIRETYGGHLDIAPTLLGLLGIVPSRDAMLGRNLLAEGPRLVVFRDGSFTDGEVYFINRPGPIERSSCFDAQSGARLDCAPFANKRAAARRQLDVSDLLIRGGVMAEIGRSRTASGGRRD